MTKEEDILRNIRISHRNAIAFYQRLLPALDHFTANLEFNYRTWHSRSCSLPNPRGNPFVKWAWDYLPLVNPRFIYYSGDGKPYKPGECVLDIELVLDSGFTQENKLEPEKCHNGPNVMDIKTTVEKAESWIGLNAFIAKKSSDDANKHICADSRGSNPEYPNADGNVIPWGGNFLAIAEQVPLEEVLADKEMGILGRRTKYLLERLEQELEL